MSALFPQDISTRPRYGSTAAGARDLARGDRDLLEMSAVFRVPRRWRLRHVLLSAVAPPVLAAVAVTLSQALRLAMMAGLLAAADGAGAGVAAARTYLDTPTVLAWALVAVAFALVVDGLVLGPARRRALAWTR